MRKRLSSVRVGGGAVFFVLALLLSSSHAVDGREPTRPRPKAERPPPAPVLHREDEPAEALRHHLRKRSPDFESPIDPARYAAALEHVDAMPRYQLATSQELPSTRDAEPRGVMPDLLGGWTSLGPGNVGGRTRALAYHPTQPTTIWAGGVAGGMFKSTDSGASWTPKGDAMSNLAISCLAVTPSNPSVLYAGTGEGYFNIDAVRGGGIFKSTDAGETWSLLAATSGGAFRYVNDVVVSSSSASRVYAATTSGIYRSTDAGASWASMWSTAYPGGVLDLVIRTDRSSDFLLASVGTFSSNPYSFILRNTDAAGSGTWQVVFTENGMGRTSLALAPSNQNVVYALSAKVDGTSAYDNGLHAVFRSSQSGDPGSWTARIRNDGNPFVSTLLLSNPVYAFGCPGVPQAFYNQGWYDNVIAVDPTNQERVWAGGIDLFRSDDGGLTWGVASYWWTSQASRFAHADHHVIAFHPQYASNQTLLAGGDGGIFRTTNALAAVSQNVCTPSSLVSWTSLNNGYSVTQFYNGAPYPSGTSYLGGTQDNGTVRGTDASGPNAWTQVLGGDGGYVAVHPTNTQVLYAENTGLSIQKSTDGGATFADATNGITESASSFGFIAPFVLDPGNPQRLWTGGRTAWRSTNAGASWQVASQQFTGTPASVSAIAVSPQDGNYVLMGQEDGYIARTTVGLSSSGSTVWSQVLPTPAAAYCSSVTFDPSNKSTAYATYSTFGVPHVWKSTNAGATWTSRDGSGGTAIPDIPVHVLVVDPSNSSRLVVGTDLGVFTSTDGGDSWMVENTGFPRTVTEALALKGTTTLFAFTHGRGAWKTDFGVAPNTAPSITAGAAVARQQGSPGTVATVATVSDAQTPAGNLVVSVEQAPAGVTLSSVTNTNGVVTALVEAGCAAVSGNVLLKVQDAGGLTSTANLSVTVSANTPPVLGTYLAASVGTGGTVTVTPGAVPSDNGGALASLTASAPGFLGTFSTNPSTGAVTVTNAVPNGTYTVTVTGTDSCGATASRTFALTVATPNTAPSITAGSSIVRSQGSPAAVLTLATVSDAQTPAGSLQVSLVSSPSGVTVTGLANSSGTVTATVQVACGAPTGSGGIQLLVTDAGGLTATASTPVTVTSNTPPSLGSYSTASVAQGAGTTVSPTGAPSDNGSIASLVASAPGFLGGLAANIQTGVVTVTNAGPPGTFTVTVTATDACAATATRTFTLIVTSVNHAPTITAGAPATLSRGQGALAATLASVADAETPASSLSVSLVSAPSGVSVSDLTNSGGTVTGSLSASCGASLGAGSITLRVTDAGSLTATAAVAVTVTANTSPALGSYPAVTVPAGTTTAVTPSVPPSDNGSVASLTASSPGFTGTFAGNASTGVVTVSNAGPSGSRTVTVTATDDCGATSTATFPLTVSGANTAPSITAGAPVSRSRGASGSVVLATVADAESAPGSLIVTVLGAPSGVTVTELTNQGGTVRGNLTADCSASLGNGTIALSVSDGALSSGTTLGVTVLVDATPPVVSPPVPSFVNVWQTRCDVAGTTLAEQQVAYPSRAAALSALLSGGAATDNCTAVPQRLTTRLGGVDVSAQTRFPSGASFPQIRFADGEGSIGVASVTVNVRPAGDLDADGDVDVVDDQLLMGLVVGNLAPGVAPLLAPVEAADVDGNGAVDVFDVVLHAAYIVGNTACLVPGP